MMMMYPNFLDKNHWYVNEMKREVAAVLLVTEENLLEKNLAERATMSMENYSMLPKSKQRDR